MDATNTYVTKIVCKAQSDTYSYTDPNEVNLGYVQDLDASKVAIIQGVAANTDSNAETALFALKMQNLKDVNYEEWQIQMDHVSGEGLGSLNKEDTNKLTVVTTSKPSDDYYVVSCDVYYTSAYSLKKENSSDFADFTDSVHYNVFSQKFYTDAAPDIYFMYEPFVIDSDNGAVYTPDDYIAISNDDATVDSKLYLIMPDESQLSVKADPDNDVNGIYTSANYAAQDTLHYKRYLRRSDNTWKTVNLHFFRLDSSAATPLQIYTNLAIKATDESKKQTYDCEAPSETNSNGTYKIGSEVTGSRANYESSYLHTLTEDTRYSGRLYTATVQLYKMNGETVADTASVRFQGGKGAN
jgi:hypothetical protein